MRFKVYKRNCVWAIAKLIETDAGSIWWPDGFRRGFAEALDVAIERSGQ